MPRTAPAEQSVLMKIVLGHSAGTLKCEKYRLSTLGLDLSGMVIFSITAIGKLPNCYWIMLCVWWLRPLAPNFKLIRMCTVPDILKHTMLWRIKKIKCNLYLKSCSCVCYFIIYYFLFMCILNWNVWCNCYWSYCSLEEKNYGLYWRSP